MALLHRDDVRDRGGGTGLLLRAEAPDAPELVFRPEPKLLGSSSCSKSRAMAPFLTLATVLSALVLGAPASGQPGTAPVAPAVRTAGRDARSRVVAAARLHVGKPFRGDCSGFVRRVYAEAGRDLPRSGRGRTGSEILYRGIEKVRRPRPGDLAFFHRTYDREPPGPGRNLFTHVGVVERVDGSRVVLVHKTNTGVKRLRMNLARPADPRENDLLRRRKPTDRPGQPHFGAQLLAGFGAPLQSGSMARARLAHAAPSARTTAAVSRVTPPAAHRLASR